MSQLREHDIQEKDGKRLLVYSREYDSSTIWTVRHNLHENRLFAQAYTSQLDTIFPKIIKKLDASTIQFQFEKPISGWASIFSLSPLLKRKRLDFTNTNYIEFHHKYHSTNYLVQFWDSDGNVFWPKNILKQDNVTVIVEFELPVSGSMELIKGFPRPFTAYYREKIWQYNHRRKITREHMFVQCTGTDNRIFVPSEITRVDPIRLYETDNRLEVENDNRIIGTVNSIIHGFKI